MSPSPSALASPACKALTASTAAASLFRTIISTLSYGYVATGGRVPSLWRAGGPGRSSHGRSVGRPAVNSRRDWHVIKNPSSASVNCCTSRRVPPHPRTSIHHAGLPLPASVCASCRGKGGVEANCQARDGVGERPGLGAWQRRSEERRVGKEGRWQGGAAQWKKTKSKGDV